MESKKQISAKKQKFKRDGREETLFLYLIKEPKKCFDEDEKKTFLNEVNGLVSRAWGTFEKSYLEKSILDDYLVCVARDRVGRMVGIEPVKKVVIDNKEAYYWGLTAVDPSYRKFRILNKMFLMLVRKIFREDMLKGKATIEAFFITPNIKILSALSRGSFFLYPNPYKADENGKVRVADNVTWHRVKKLISILGEKPKALKREGCVMTGFYDDRPHLIQKDESKELRNQRLAKFKARYLKPGNDIVGRAKISFLTIFKS